VSYSDAVKQDLLDVPDSLLATVGAVSAEVAEAMTTGALARFPVARVVVAVTGIAGPDGGSVDKPVGLTYVAAALSDGAAVVERHIWPFDRDGNKRASALAAIELAARVTSEA
jgi:nicotinamide-nucleotide amidase